MPRDAPDPVRLPEHVWHDPTVLALCRAQDANGLLRLAKKYGNTNESLGYWTGIDPGEISKRTSPNGRKTGSPIQSLDRWQRIADGFNMPDHARYEVGLASRDPSDRLPPQPAAVQPTQVEHAGDLNARLDQARNGMRFMIAPLPSSGGVQLLEESVEMAGRKAVTTPPAAMLAALLDEFESAQEMLRSAVPQQVRGRAIRASAVLATLIGEDLMILSKARQSAQWFNAAGRLAQAAGDNTAHSNALTLHARLPLYFGEVAESVELARDAQDLAASGNIFSASLGPMIEALALAQLGDRTNSLDALDAARRSFRVPVSAEDEESVFGFPHRRFAFYESRVLLDTGNLPAAWDAQEAALSQYPSSGNGDVIVLHLDRARLLVSAGDVRDGCVHAVRTLTALPEDQQAPLFTKRAWRVLAAVPRSEARSPAATELSDLLRSSAV